MKIGISKCLSNHKLPVFSRKSMEIIQRVKIVYAIIDYIDNPQHFGQGFY